MDPRRVGLMTFILIGLVAAFLLAPGCDSDERLGGGTVDWGDMGPMLDIPLALTIDDLQEKSGLQLMLPSYLPPRMRSYEAIWVGDIPGAGEPYRAEITLPPSPSAPSLKIEIDEWARVPARPEQDRRRLMLGDEGIAIGGSAVLCRLEPHYLLQTPPPTPDMSSRIAVVPLPRDTLTPQFSCRWDTEDLHLYVTFSWSLSEPIPSLITSEMKLEAMKVVRSMIEGPYSP